MTHRLTDSPSCIVADEHDMGGNLARILKAAGQKAPEMKPILEINPRHPAVQRLSMRKPASMIGRYCSNRRRWPRAVRSKTPPDSSCASTT